MKSLDIGVLDDFVDGQARQVRLDGLVLVVVRIEGDVYVLDDRCSHEDFSLAEGEVNVDTREIECARHGAMFRLRDGEPMSFPATRPVAHYEVHARDGRLEVSVP
ncbi:MAG: Rieske 2Fe-2S domain-containing protein [Acidimicrobiales bacterium]